MLLARADWGVHMVPTVEGSYEGQPPTLPDVVARDRRWAQGNLQHLGIVFSSGITTMGRLHLLMGATSYLMSLVWASRSLVGIVLALQGQQMIPSYFIDEKTLFPVWPVTDPGAALRLFFATMLVVLMPKFLGLALEIKRARHARESLGRHARRARRHHRDAVLDPAVADPDGDADGRRVPGAVRARLGLAHAEPATVPASRSWMRCAITAGTC